METGRLPRPAMPLEGENLETAHWEDARHWLSIYADLLRFKQGLLERVQRELPKLPPVARRAAATDLEIISQQMLSYQARLDLWYQRAWQLRGLWIDPDSHVVRHKGQEATLTKREFQLLQFLLDHPHRFFSVHQILGQAWGEPSLFPEEVRNYVRRVRKILAQLEIPAAVVNRPGQGYSLVFQVENA
jgi:DNA-binding response OmpR family regulator